MLVLEANAIVPQRAFGITTRARVPRSIRMKFERAVVSVAV